MVERFGPMAAVIVLFGFGLVWRPWLQRRRFGTSGIVLFRSGDWLQHAREAGLVAMSLLMCAQALIVALAPRFLDPAAILNRPPLGGWPGLAIAGVATAFLVAAQLDLGASWRVGIDLDARPGLVTGGVYALSRNPIYLAMLLFLAGFALLVPTWFSFALPFAALIGFRRQAIYEEAYLRRAYGEAFDRYARRVGRFVPGFGRLA